MSYVSGFMLGASIGKAIHSMLLQGGAPASAEAGQPADALGMPEPSIPVFSCVSALPGRRRYRAAGLRGNETLKGLLEQTIAGLSGVDRVQVSAVTGSILICASEGVLDRIEYFLRSRIFTAPAAVDENPAAAYQPGGKTSVYADALYETLDLLSNIISQKTARVLDLRSLLSLILIVRGMRKMILLNQRPSGPQMVWWAASLMRGR